MLFLNADKIFVEPLDEDSQFKEFHNFAVASMLKNNYKQSKLSLKKKSIGARTLSMIMEPLQNNTHIKEIDLCKN